MKRLRIKKAHERFLEACRSLSPDAAWLAGSGRLRTWLARALVPIPLLGLHPGGGGLLNALQWLEFNCRQLPLSEEVLRQYHSMVYDGVAELRGAYRKHELVVSDVRRPAADKVPSMMKMLDVKLKQEQKDLDREKPTYDSVLALAVEIHRKIGHIHPFADANGRVARLAMNHVLRRYGAGYVVYPSLSDSPQLWEDLKRADRGDPKPLLAFAQGCMHSI